VAALLVGLAVAVALALWIARPWESQTALDRFWAPVLSSPDPVSVYIGGYITETPPVNTIDLQNSEKVAFADATALARVTALLVSHNRPYRIRFQMSSKLEDLRDGPAVLIGAFNNSFALRLTSPLRFSFLSNRETMVNRIQDRNDPQNPKWSDDMNAPYQNLKQDFAIVSPSSAPRRPENFSPAAPPWKRWLQGLPRIGTARTCRL
jgi:hypothetical protein